MPAPSNPNSNTTAINPLHLQFAEHATSLLAGGNKRPDLAPGGWWQRGTLAFSWMPSTKRPPRLLIGNTHNTSFGHLSSIGTRLEETLQSTLAADRAALAALVKTNPARFTFREILLATAILNFPANP